jgi:uncharacterized protein
MNDQVPFTVDRRNRVIRQPNRAAYDQGSIFAIVDQALVCHVSFIENDQPVCIPMLFSRIDRQLVFHGATSSRLMKTIAGGCELCVTVVLLDGLVMARSLFHHSMNYRSVSLFGRGREVSDVDEKLAALKSLSDKVMIGRWDDARAPNQKELKATMVAMVEIESAAAKVRSGGPVDDVADMDLPVWVGEIQFHQNALVETDRSSSITEIPGYVNNHVMRFNTKD